MKQSYYIAIDLKSFYASVECVERGYDPLNTNLVVADESRTDKTIVLAVSPALKSLGVPNRPRLFEAKSAVKNINHERAIKNHIRQYKGKSIYLDELNNNKNLEVDFVVAKPRMNFYMDYSSQIYNIYLQYISSDDIVVYSIDEVFIDVTPYLNTYKKSPKEIAQMLMKEVFNKTGITATCGIGTNLYLAKVAMDILAKHALPDEFGVRIAELNEQSYKEQLWDHTPLSDFWRIGPGISNRLNKHGIYTMGEVARCSLECEELLYKEFGINAELLIDHAWGIEPTRISDIKAYKPTSKSLSQGQVLTRPYSYDETKVVVKEMIELLVLDLTNKHYLSNCLTLAIGYDTTNLKEEGINNYYNGDIVIDHYGRKVPKTSSGTIRSDHYSDSYNLWLDKAMLLFDSLVDPNLLTRRITLCFSNLKDVNSKKEEYISDDLFTDIDLKIEEEKKEAKQQNLQKAIITIKDKYGKNSILKGTSLEKGATTRLRNKQVGGHNA